MNDPAAVAQEAAERLTEPFEGFSAIPYRDEAGVWTQGDGSTRDGDGNPITADSPPIDRATALAWAERDLRAAVQTVEADVTVPLSQDEEAALTDWVYNLGAGNFAASTMLRKLNAGDRLGAADEMLRWDMAGGKVLAGLLRRREAERTLFLSGQ